MWIRRGVRLLQRGVSWELRRQIRPLDLMFDSPFLKDPLFRVGLAVSAVAVWAGIIALTFAEGWYFSVGLVPAFLLGPLAVNIAVFGVVGCSIRGFWRGLTGRTNTGVQDVAQRL